MVHPHAYVMNSPYYVIKKVIKVIQTLHVPWYNFSQQLGKNVLHLSLTKDD